METKAIEVRYNDLAEDDNCCLSCGGAADMAEIRKGEICVDLGSGRGSDVLRIASQVGSEGFSYGVDISENMIAKAEKQAKKLGVMNASFVRSELEDINLDSDLANVVISNCTINHASDKQATWNEIFRILKKGGRFIVSDIYSLEPIPEKYRTDPAAVAECWAGSVTKEEYLASLEKAGFKNITIMEDSAPYPKGAVQVCSFTITGTKPGCCC